MINAITGNEYTGQNEQTLMSLGFDETDSFLTFKQAIKVEGVSGKALKGIKKAASLVRYVNEENKETGKKEMKPRYFSVFNYKEVISRRAA